MPEMTLRPFEEGEFIQNEDGSRSTERTVTIRMPDGRWMNAPSLWMTGQGPADFEMDEDTIMSLALQYEKQTGQEFPRFKNSEEAIRAARIRSSRGGASSGSLAR